MRDPAQNRDANCIGRVQMGGLDSVQEVESRELVAQLVEQRPFKAWVLGSNPSGLTTHRWLSFLPPQSAAQAPIACGTAPALPADADLPRQSTYRHHSIHAMLVHK